jgi:hypothetical protein
MTKLIVIFIIAICLFGGWRLFLYWDQVNHENEEAKKQESSEIVTGSQLGGLTQQLDRSLDAAQREGAAGLRNWLKTYGPRIQDPRKAWIELDYCVAVARENPSEAKRVFAEVKSRTPANSPVYPRIKKLESTYE